MARLSSKQITTVYRKETLEILRDRRTLILMLVVPVLLYPILALGSVQLMSIVQSRLDQKTLVVGITMQPPIFDTAALDTIAADMKLKFQDTTEDAATDQVRSGTLAAVLIVTGDTPPAADDESQVRAKLIYDSGELESKEARARVRDFLTDHSDELVAARLAHFQHAATLIDPVDIDSEDVATAEEKGAFAFGGILSFLLITMALMGAFYPALDLTAGERERNTLETLLAAPVGRREMVLGKYLTVLTLCLATSALNIACMGFAFSQLFAGVAGQGADIQFEITFPILLRIAAILFPLAALFSAVAIGTSSFARSYKEGQNYLTPLFMVVMFPAMLAVLPGIKLNLAFAAIPVAGPALLFRELLLGKATFLHGAVVFATTVVYAWLLLTWVAQLFEREEVLFRGEGQGIATMRRPLTPTSTPSSLAAAGLFITALAIMGYVVMNATVDGGVTQTVIAPQLGLYLALPLLVAWWCRHDLRRTFSLRTPGWTSWLAVPLLWIGTHPLAHFFQPTETESLKHFKEYILALIDSAGPYGVLALVALLPAVCEEIFCRGYLLSGLRQGMNRWFAVLVTAGLFGILHLDPGRVLPTATLGLFMGIIVLRTGSILPAMLFHLLNNGIGIAATEEYREIHAGTWPAQLGGTIAGWAEQLDQLGTWQAPIVVVALLLGLALLRKPGAATSTPASSTPASSTPASSTPASSTPASSTPASSTPASSTHPGS
ncbi:MAG: ABC transporter permease subunit/CPBP intramembrane protease [Planctomycetota bacterium]